jgi:hypothetical protein
MKSASANDSRIVIPAEAGMTGILRLWDSSGGRLDCVCFHAVLTLLS